MFFISKSFISNGDADYSVYLNHKTKLDYPNIPYISLVEMTSQEVTSEVVQK